MINEYEQKITKDVTDRNNKNIDIEFIPHLPCPNSTQYKISIHDLLTSERSQILKIRGVKLYMCICSSQKYKSMSNVELLHELHNEYTGKTNIHAGTTNTKSTVLHTAQAVKPTK